MILFADTQIDKLYFQLFNYFQLLRLIRDYVFRNLIFILQAIAGALLYSNCLILSQTWKHNTNFIFLIL